MNKFQKGDLVLIKDGRGFMPNGEIYGTSLENPINLEFITRYREAK
jgi:hypothetical protein